MDNQSCQLGMGLTLVQIVAQAIVGTVELKSDAEQEQPHHDSLKTQLLVKTS
jgi:hypothetical protein